MSSQVQANTALHNIFYAVPVAYVLTLMLKPLFTKETFNHAVFWTWLRWLAIKVKIQTMFSLNLEM